VTLRIKTYYRRILRMVLVRVCRLCALLRDCEQEVRVYASLLKFFLHLLKDMNVWDIPCTGLQGSKF